MADEDKTKSFNEISLLMDEQLGDGEVRRVLNQLSDDRESRATWMRYHWIGHCIRNGQVTSPDAQFQGRVAAAIAQEPTILAPRREITRQRVVSLALAASLASLAILVGYSVRENTAEFSRGANLAMSSSVTAAKTLPTRESVAQSRFNDYLVIHNETAYQAGSPGLMPYARLVSSGSEF